MIILTPSDSSHGEEGSDSGEGFHAEWQPKLSVYNSKIVSFVKFGRMGRVGRKTPKKVDS